MTETPVLPIIVRAAPVTTTPLRLVAGTAAAKAVKPAAHAPRIVVLAQRNPAVKRIIRLVATKPVQMEMSGIVRNVSVGWKATTTAVATPEQGGIPIVRVSPVDTVKNSVTVRQILFAAMENANQVSIAPTARPIVAVPQGKHAKVDPARPVVPPTVHGTTTVARMAVVDNVVIASVGADNVTATVVTIA